MQNTTVQSVDLLVHPFYKLAKEAGFSALTQKQRAFALFLQGTWKKTIIDAKKRSNCLFVIVGYPLSNNGLISAYKELCDFGKKQLGNRARVCSFSLSQKMGPTGKIISVSLEGTPFRGVRFAKNNPIIIRPFGEDLGICPITEALFLQRALNNAGYKTKVVQIKGMSVKKMQSMKRNVDRMLKKPRTSRQIRQRAQRRLR